MSPISKRLRASLACDAINGDSMERSICASQMKEAANRIDELERKLAAAREALKKANAYINARDELDMIDRDSRNWRPARDLARTTWTEYRAALASLENSSPQTTEKPNHQ